MNLRSTLSVVLALLFLGSFASADVVPVTEVYGTASDGTVLHWVAYTPTTPGPWPAVLLIHGGGFKAGDPSSSAESVACGQDLAAAGYLALSIEYRLAPPGSLLGQTSLGLFPDQVADVNLAIRTARNDPRCSGQVGGVGGSAGGYHVAYAAAAGTRGYDRLDVGVSMSGAYDLSDFSPSWNIKAFTEDVTAYVGVTTANLTSLRNASPAWVLDGTVSPLYLMNTVGDPMPYVQLSDMLAHLDAVECAKLPGCYSPRKLAFLVQLACGKGLCPAISARWFRGSAASLFSARFGARLTTSNCSTFPPAPTSRLAVAS